MISILGLKGGQNDHQHGPRVCSWGSVDMDTAHCFLCVVIVDVWSYSLCGDC